MTRSSENGGRRGLPRSPWRAGATWLGLAVVATFLLAACGGDGDDSEADPQMFDASGKPMEKDTIVRLYSMTKAIATAAAMMLAASR